jgi:hypothetical protein
LAWIELEKNSKREKSAVESAEKIKGPDLDGEKLSLGERREIESLRRKFMH